MNRYEADNRADTFVPHAFQERTIELGEIRMNFVRVGTESWWGYEPALPLLAAHFEVFAVDLRGQGRSTWTPGRYTLDNMGGDLVRFIDLVIGRPAIVSGLSSGGLLAAWLSAYAKPGQIRAAHYEDPPLFNAESDSPSFLAGRGSPFALWRKYLGNQWQVGDWAGMRAAASHELLPWLAAVIEFPEQPTQNMKEYDPVWASACCAGTLTASCDHAQMLSSVNVPVLFTHHFRHVDVTTERLLGVPSDAQAARVRELVTGAVHPDAGRVGGHAAMTVY